MFNWNSYDLFTTNSSNTNCTISTSRLHQSIHNTGYLTENHQRRTFPKKKTEKPSCIPIGTPKKSPKTQYSIPLETEYATPILSLYERYTTTEHDKQRGKRYDSWFYWLFIVVPASSEHDAAKKKTPPPRHNTIKGTSSYIDSYACATATACLPPLMLMLSPPILADGYPAGWAEATSEYSLNCTSCTLQPANRHRHAVIIVIITGNQHQCESLMLVMLENERTTLLRFGLMPVGALWPTTTTTTTEHNWCVGTIHKPSSYQYKRRRFVSNREDRW